MGGQYGTKETEDVLYVAKVVTLCILREVKKDGFQASDLGAFLKSAEFEAALGPALENVQVVPQELTELDFRDDLKLGRAIYGVVTDVLEELRAAVKK